MTRPILFTGAGLLALWALSFGLSFVNLGAAGLVIALAIAAVKAGLVGWVFMELAHAPASIRFAVVAASALAALLIAFVVADVEMRDPPPLIAPGYDSPPVR